MVLILVWVAAGILVLGFPPKGTPVDVDAVVVLGPATPDRYEVGLALVEAGYSDTLVVSVGPLEREELESFCNGESSFTIFCFSPDPSATRGEAQAVSLLATEHGWESMMIVTTPSHMTRALLYFERCFDGDLTMIDDEINRPDNSAFDLFLYESGAFIKYLTTWGC